MARMEDVFLKHIDIRPENVRTINPAITKETMYDYCQEYEQSIADEGGIDVALCEIAPNGTIAFNEPGSQASSYCRLVLLGNETRHRISKEFKCDDVPTTAITLGMANLVSPAVCSPWHGAKTAPTLSSAQSRSTLLRPCRLRCCRDTPM